MTKRRSDIKVVFHGLSKSMAYRSYQSMIHSDKQICIRWCDKKNGFLNFLEDMGHPPNNNSLRKKNDDKCFEKDNCIWLERKVPIPIINHNAHLLFTSVPLDKEGAGIYRIIFNTGYYYIGSTKNFRTRFIIYRTEFRKKVYGHSKKMNEAIQKSTNAIFEILEVIEESNSLKIREGFYLKKNNGNPFLINRAINPFSNKGVKWDREEIEKAKITSKMRGVPKRGKGKKTLALLS